MVPSPLQAGRLGALLLGLALGACEPMESRGNPFTPAPKPSAALAPSAADPAFDFPSEPPLLLSSEQMARGDLGAGLATAAGVDPDTLGEDPAPPPVAPAPAPPAAAPAATVAPLPTGLPATVSWPVRLVSTLPNAQPPRAIVGLSSGEERVVSPGSILVAEGLVVMTVSEDRVQLARVEPAGDHARITTFELTAQYPTGR
jgi:hypothetical protein